jgi:hypothetical protein
MQHGLHDDLLFEVYINVRGILHLNYVTYNLQVYSYEKATGRLTGTLRSQEYVLTPLTH